MLFSSKNRPGFTLVELLVVIAIMSLISSLILAWTSGSRERARIAAALDFSHRVQNAIGDQAVGVWNFEEIVLGNKVIDTSGYRNRGTVNGATLEPGIQNNGNTGNALRFNGGEYVRVPNSTSISNYSKGVTVELWFNASRIDVQQGQFGQNGPGYLNFWMDSGTGYTRLRWETDDEQYLYSNTKISPNKWYHAVGVYNTANGKASLFINGNLDSKESLTFNPLKTADIIIGGYRHNMYNFYGLIDEVRIYEIPLTVGEVSFLYNLGATARGLAQTK